MSRYRREIPTALRRALRMLSPADAAEAARDYLAANAEDRAGMLAFVEGGGPEFCRKLRDEHESGR